MTNARKLADKIWGLRIMDDDNGRDEPVLADTGGEVLIVSQFTLYGDTTGGRRPSWINAARPEHAEPLVQAVVDQLRAAGAVVATGRFRTEMHVSLVNDGPGHSVVGGVRARRRSNNARPGTIQEIPNANITNNTNGDVADVGVPRAAGVQRHGSCHHLLFADRRAIEHVTVR